MLVIIFLVLVTGLISFRLYRTYNYWTIRGVKQKDVVPLFGHSWMTIWNQIPLPEMVRNIYAQFPNNRYSGFYQFALPTFLVRDPKLIKQIGVKDFAHFRDHGTYLPEDCEPLWGKNLLNLKGTKWRQMRATLSPFFSSSKMKAMFHLMSECGENFTNYFLNHPEDCRNVDMKDVLTRYTNDMIGTIAFGVKCDSLETKDNEFYLMGKKVTDFSGMWKSILLYLAFQSHNLTRIFKFRMFDDNVLKFFTDIISETIKVRKEKNIVKPDMLHLLMEARKGKQSNYDEYANGNHVRANGKYVEESITEEDITAQALIFFFGGFETVSLVMNFMAYELATNTDIQSKLQEEIDEVYQKCNGNINHDALTKMKYMDMVVSETLRKWPSFGVIDRICIKPYTIVPKTLEEKPVHLEQNSLVWIPIYAIHHDPQYYPEPESFDPERFKDENKSKINPYTYIPFGVGPRYCIGSRFALLETKILFFHILSKFELVRNKKTPILIKLQKNVFNIKPEELILLTMRPRKKPIFKKQ